VSGERVLVTGGGGFIGSGLVERLLADGFRVRVLDNFATGRRENLDGFDGDVELIEGDIQSYERVHDAVRGSEVVFHQAALPSVPRSIQDPLTSNAVNVIGTLNVLLASRDEGVRRVVSASSSSIYGGIGELPNSEDMPTRPIAPYAVSKLAAEGYCRCFHEVYGLETVSLRYFNVFGPRQDPLSHYSAVIPRFMLALLDGLRLTIHGDGEQSRDFTYIDNAVDATVAATTAPDVGGKVFNVACGSRTSIADLHREVCSLAGTDVQAEYTDPRPGDVRHSVADISRARAALAYEPLIDVREGLRRTFDWYVAAR
jgi:UDP-glucose 4-epimerase